MRAIEAETFSGYGGLKQTDLPKPLPAKDRVLVRVTAAGVTPLDHTILSGGHPRAKAPLVLGNEGAGVIKDAGASGLAVGSRVMFTGPYGVRESGAWEEWLLARPEDLALAPDAIDDVVAASLPVAYLTAQITLTLAGFKPGMTVLAPGIGGSVGNATYQLARAQGAGKVISTAGSAAKAAVSPIAPGLMLFTRIFRSFRSFVQLRANDLTAALAAAYTLVPAYPLRCAFEAMRMIEPPARIRGSAFWTVNSVPLTLRLSVSSTNFSEINPIGLSTSPPPALAKTMSMWPFSDFTFS